MVPLGLFVLKKEKEKTNKHYADSDDGSGQFGIIYV